MVPMPSILLKTLLKSTKAQHRTSVDSLGSSINPYHDKRSNESLQGIYQTSTEEHERTSDGSRIILPPTALVKATNSSELWKPRDISPTSTEEHERKSDGTSTTIILRPTVLVKATNSSESWKPSQTSTEEKEKKSDGTRTSIILPPIVLAKAINSSELWKPSTTQGSNMDKYFESHVEIGFSRTVTGLTEPVV